MRMFIAKLVNKSSTIKHFAAYRSSKGSINKYQTYCRSAKLWIGLQSTWNLLKSAFEIRVTLISKAYGLGSSAEVHWLQLHCLQRTCGGSLGQGSCFLSLQNKGAP